MAMSTLRAPSASDESRTLGAGLTAERVPPAPCAAITIATRASRETGTPTQSGDHHGNEGGADGRGQGGQRRAWAGPTVERLAHLTSRRHRGRERIKCLFS